MKWEKEEDNLLTMEYNQGLSISLMMKNHQRFRKEIESRIEELGLDNEPEKECVQSSPFHLNGDALNFDEPRTKIKKKHLKLFGRILYPQKESSFTQKTGLSFTYEIQDKDWVYISRSKYPISKDEFEKCYTRTPEKKYHCL